VKVSIFVGDIVNAPAEAVCTSTNPRLSLMMGTGAAVREKGGFEILRACEALIEAESLTSGKKFLRAGSAHVTTAGRLPFKAVIHCVASDTSHMSSPDVVRACTKSALAAAARIGCRSVAMPVFASGHARVKFDRAVQAMAEAIRDSQTSVEEVAIVVLERERAEEVRRIVDAVMNGP
jgi:O-acetyl-ADP-ribose deacetylase (regulator of RNase III)